MKLFRNLSLLALILLFSACSGGGGGQSSARGCDSLNARIFGGETCDQFSRSPVVAILPIATNGEAFVRFGTCSGALVTVDDLLTSAHCFVNPIVEARSAGIDIAGFLVLVGGQGGQTLAISNLQIHPNYNGQVGSAFDLAMATLNEIPNPPIGPLPILLSELTLPGSEVTAFGYGTNDQNVDDTLKAANFTISSLAGGNLIVEGNGSSSICPGDSGGPVTYVTEGGITTIAAVNSFGSSGACVDSAAESFGFVDLQRRDVIDFITNYAPDVAAG